VGRPDNSVPARPPQVPSEARWDPGKAPGFEWKLGGVDDAGRKHGLYRSWTREGVLHAETMYEHGDIHGTNKNFHPDGSVSSEATWIRGVIMDSVCYRSDHATSERFAHAAANVWSVRYYTRDGKTNYTIRYFTRDGVECGPDGHPLPPRPARVSAEARWFPDLDRWVDGEIERGTNAQLGRWRWWTRDGVLRHEQMRDARGEVITIADYRGDGTLHRRIQRDASGEVREHFFADGTRSTCRRDDARGREIYQASWSRAGALEQEIERTFDGEQLASVRERGRSGAPRFEARREGAAAACLLYRDGGRGMLASGTIAEGRLAGTWCIFDDAGGVRREADLTALALAQPLTGDGLTWQLGEALYRLDEPALDTPAVLAGVDDEPWRELEGAYDEHVEQLPRLLRAAVSSDPLVRDYALGAIACELEDQGAIYPVTARALPYLARLLADSRADRARILALLATIAEVASDEGTAAAVGSSWPHIFAVFRAATQDERRAIFAIARRTAESRANLLEVACGDADPCIRAWATDSITASDDYALGDVLPVLGDRDPIVRCAAAIAIACTKPSQSPRDVVSALATSVRGWRELAPRFAQLPHTEHHLLAHLAVALGSISNPDARSLAPLLCDAIGEVDSDSAAAYGRGLLALAFGNGERPFAKRCVEIVSALATSAQFWSRDEAASEILARWNLPRTRHLLTALVTELEAARDPEAILHARIRAPV
jgi:hypothetical protein